MTDAVEFTGERRSQHNPEVQLAVLSNQMTNLVRDVAIIGGKVDALDIKIESKTQAISDKVDAKTAAISVKVDALDDEQQRAKGVLAVVRWLGVGGVSIATGALLLALGVHA